MQRVQRQLKRRIRVGGRERSHRTWGDVVWIFQNRQNLETRGGDSAGKGKSG